MSNVQWITPADLTAILSWASSAYKNSGTANHLPSGPYRQRPLLTDGIDLIDIIPWEDRPASLAPNGKNMKDPINAVYTMIVAPHDPSEGGKTTGTRAQPSHAAIDVYRPTDLPDDWRIHRITPVKPTAYGWRSYPDPWTTTDDAVPWIPLTEEDAYDLHPCHPFVQRFIDKGIEACVGDNELDAED